MGECLAAAVRLQAVFAERAQFPRTVLAQIDMDPFEAGDPALGRLGEIVIGVMHVDVLGIAARARQGHREQHRRLWRRRVIGVIGVKGLAGDVTFTGHGLLV